MIAFSNEPQEIGPPPLSRKPVIIASLCFGLAIACTLIPMPWYHRWFQVGLAAYGLGYVQGAGWAAKRWAAMYKEVQDHTRDYVRALASKTKREVFEAIFDTEGE